METNTVALTMSGSKYLGEQYFGDVFKNNMCKTWGQMHEFLY